MSAALRDDLGRLFGQGPRDGHVLPAAAAREAIARHGLSGTDALMQALLPLAQELAQAPISHFRVGAVGRAAGSGDLLLGANQEFPGAALGETIHAEQFLFSRAYHRGDRLERIAVTARPCGHCRQFMAEFAGREALVVLDPEGPGTMTLGDLLPAFFSPADLGEAGAVARSPAPLDFALAEEAALAGLRDCAHAPYGGGPAAILLRLRDGVAVPGVLIENAAYNPGLPPLQAALVNLRAAGRAPQEIAEAVLIARPGPADYAPAVERLLRLLAPEARFRLQI